MNKSLSKTTSSSYTNSAEVKEKYAESAIIRIKLESFVTYDSLEFMPGPNLNVIIGPNGTGKSTVVCAICLGMGGKPVVLGRAGSVSDFIKYGKNQATIEIELNNKKGKNYVIRRIIYRSNQSDWFIGDNQSKFKEVEELISSLNIQVANLCQFLPQEKVAEFARMNKIELLESTEKAVGGIEMAEMHNDLIEKRKLARDFEKDSIQVEESLKREEAINSRLDVQVSSFMERRQYEEKITWLKRKRACLYYKEKRDEFEKAKKDQVKISKDLNELGNIMEPLEERQKEIDKLVSKQKGALNSKMSEIQDYTRSVHTLTTKLSETSERLTDMKADYATKEKELKQRNNKIEDLKTSIDLIQNEIEESKSDLAEIQQVANRHRQEESQLRQKIEEISTEEHDLKSEFARQKNELNRLDRELEQMKNVRDEKMRKLRERANHAHAATEWLDNNRQQFKGKVFEPMVLNINMKIPQAAKYVEHLIPNRDLTSMFLFERSEDMHHFLSEVRDNRKLAVNAALIPSQPLSNFQPPRSIEQIKKFGFKSFLRETIDAPEPILVYLCMYTGMHQVPVGDDETQRNISSILPHIDDFSRIYTSSHQYSFSRSRYTQKVSSSSAEVPDAFWLTSSVKADQLSQIEDRRRAILAKLKEIEAKIYRIGEERKSIETKIEAINNETSKLNEKRFRIENLGKKLSAQTAQLKKLESTKTSLVDEVKNIMRLLPEMTKKKANILAEFSGAASKLIQFNKERVAAAYKEAKLGLEKRQIDVEMRDHILRRNELESEKARFIEIVKRAKELAQAALDKASEINGIPLDKGCPPEHKAKFADLPDTVDKIDAEISQTEALSQASTNVDEKTVADYFARQKEIERLKAELEKHKKKIKNHKSDYEEKKNTWLTKVEQMIQDINTKFAALFQQLKCTGEICLSRPENSEEFAEYGVCIKVSFRKEEQLQELTAWQQSGGEKSVSTMMYMIALQEMTKCPFRVVDEINQGMDPVNERKVFDIIVQNSCSKRYAQYFLLTPKLLPDLSFDDRTNVICVYNGPYNLPHNKYNIRNIIENRKKLNAKSI